MLGCKVFRRPESQEAHVRRQDEILTAAEHCFVQSGFHRTTIQNIASEAGMSVGNLYRYFASKDAVVEALIGRDQARIAKDFDQLQTDDLMGAFASLMRRQIVERGRDKAVLWLEICAEAARNPTVAEVTQAHKEAIAGHLATFFAKVMAERRRRSLPAGAEPETLAQLVIMLFWGLTIMHALAPEPAPFDARVDHLLSIVAAAVEGRMPFGHTAERPVGVFA